MILQDPISKQLLRANNFSDGIHFYIMRTTDEQEIKQKLTAIANVMSINREEDISDPCPKLFTCPLNKIRNLIIHEDEVLFVEEQYVSLLDEGSPYSIEGSIFIEAYSLTIPIIYE